MTGRPQIPGLHNEEGFEHHAERVLRESEAAAGTAVRKHLQHLKLKGRSARTIEERDYGLKRLAGFLTVPLLDATAEDLYEWRASLAVADSTAAVYISNVAGFYRWALTSGLVAADPTAGLPVPSVPRKLPRPIADEDLAYALSMASPAMPVRMMLRLASGCGMRAKEIAGLRAENMRLHDVPPAILIASDATKGRRERMIPLSPHMLAEFAAAGLPPASGPVFRDTYGRPHKPYMISRICNQHLHGCGISSTLHSLRDWFLTKAYAVDYDLRAVQELAGHAVVQTTATYAAVGSGRTAAIVNAMPDAAHLTRKQAS